jgi:hypothetical protein
MVPIFGEAAAGGLSQLRTLVTTGDDETRLAATKALIAIDPTGRTILDDLIARIADPADAVSLEAVRALDRMGQSASRSAEALRARLNLVKDGERWRLPHALARVTGGTDRLVRDVVAGLLGPSGLPSPNVFDDLEPLRPVEELRAGLVKEGVTPEAVHLLFQLRRHGEDAKPALAAIVERLGSPERNMRTAAAFAIGAMGPAAGEAVPALARALDVAVMIHAEGDTWDSRTRQLVDALIDALGELGPAGKAALPSLARADEPIRAALALEQMEATRPPLFQMAIDPALRVGGGRWLEAWDASGPAPSLEPATATVALRNFGIREITVRKDYEAIHLFLRRTSGGAVEVWGEQESWTKCTGSRRSILDGSITLRTNDFGSGRPIEARLTTVRPLFEFRIAHEVWFTCPDPFLATR